MLKTTLACCKLYISESCIKASLESIERAAKLLHEAKLINKFEDETYNRVGYTLVSKLPPKLPSGFYPLKDAPFAMVESAYKAIDFNVHSGSHPRLGVVDHTGLHPLANATLEQTANMQGPWPKILAPSLKFLSFYMEQHMRKDGLLIQ